MKVHTFTYNRYKKQWPLVRFSQDDKFMFRISNEKVLEIYETGSMEMVHSAKVDPCEFVTIQPVRGDKFLYICYSLKALLNVQAKEGII